MDELKLWLCVESSREEREIPRTSFPEPREARQARTPVVSGGGGARGGGGGKAEVT